MVNPAPGALKRTAKRKRETSVQPAKIRNLKSHTKESNGKQKKRSEE